MNKKIATTIMMTMIAATAVLGMGLLSQQAHAQGPILICHGQPGGPPTSCSYVVQPPNDKHPGGIPIGKPVK
jgi:hypothetical protein